MNIKFSTSLLSTFIVLFVAMTAITPSLGRSKVDWIFHTYEVKQAIRQASLYHLKGYNGFAMLYLKNAYVLTLDNPSQTKRLNVAIHDLATNNKNFESHALTIIDTEEKLLKERMSRLQAWRQIIGTLKSFLSIGLVTSLIILLMTLKKLGI